MFRKRARAAKHAPPDTCRLTRARAQDVLWFNMREEPVVYVNGLPFVLREHRRPLKNLQVRLVCACLFVLCVWWFVLCVWLEAGVGAAALRAHALARDRSRAAGAPGAHAPQAVPRSKHTPTSRRHAPHTHTHT
jgi:hypothetical protein